MRNRFAFQGQRSTGNELVPFSPLRPPQPDLPAGKRPDSHPLLITPTNNPFRKTRFHPISQQHKLHAMISFVRRLWIYVQPYRARLAMGLICGILFALTNVALVGVVRLVINSVFPAGPNDKPLPKTGHLPDWLQHFFDYIMAHLPTIPPPDTKVGMARAGLADSAGDAPAQRVRLSQCLPDDLVHLADHRRSAHEAFQSFAKPAPELFLPGEHGRIDFPHHQRLANAAGHIQQRHQHEHSRSAHHHLSLALQFRSDTRS